MVGLLIAPTTCFFFYIIYFFIGCCDGFWCSRCAKYVVRVRPRRINEQNLLKTNTCLVKIKKNQALFFGVVLTVISVSMLYYFTNSLSAILLAFTISFYFFIYTSLVKKKKHSQNIVIGGAAGALPPVIGWTISTGTISIEPIILFLIIFSLDAITFLGS